ncbi:DUF2958 domain-containing protein [Kiloniella litopenaei]|uniref:DUF2958 domain-containing protein n=1 Tax=Kiloniella litopenaei TaxID=1549748 RepID=UPI000B10D201|nr:DUF2958 domain-containing protein [Kiloniella litopenaei]
MKLITKEIREKLLSNFKNEDADHTPVLKLFSPWNSATWLITEMVEGDEDKLFGLCDLGFGSPELGYVSLSEIEDIDGPLGLRIERDMHFKPRATLSIYVGAARMESRIVFDQASLEAAYMVKCEKSGLTDDDLKAQVFCPNTGKPLSFAMIKALAEVEAKTTGTAA